MNFESALANYLKSDILPNLTPPPYGDIEFKKLSPKMPVLLVHEKLSNVKIVIKAFQYGTVSLNTAWERAEKEYEFLKLMQEKYDMSSGDFRIVAPLGKNKELAATLVIEFAKGNSLDYYIKNAIQKNETDKLLYKLRFMARFLVKLHGNTQSDKKNSPETPRKYLKRLLSSLEGKLISNKETNYIKDLASSWWNREEVFSDNEVLVHGDATPTNFLFMHEKVTGIDLEKMKWADRCWDLGFLAAELKHNFLNAGRSSNDSEPYIKNLLLEYAAGFKDFYLFKNITRRLPLYMSLGLLRISRNDWLSKEHRHKMVEEAKMCLKYRA